MLDNHSDLEVDWLVAGAGAAGMTSAVVAHQLGGSVLVSEKEAVYGGTTAKSGGVIWIPGNHRQAEAGVSDSTEEGYAYLNLPPIPEWNNDGWGDWTFNRSRIRA